MSVAPGRELELYGRAVFCARLAAAVRERPAPLLVLQLPELERVAWRRGHAAAKNLEAAALRSFRRVAGGALRAGDIAAHDAQSDTIAIALLARGRDARGSTLPQDCRTTLARLAAVLAQEAGTAIRTGWTLLREAADLDEAVRAALEHGERERERLGFFSTVGHELRTPISAIRGYLETVLDGAADPATARRFLETARSETLRMGRLVEGMLELSLLDVTPAADGALTDLRSACATVADALLPAAHARGSAICVAALPEIDLALEPDRFVQALSNVVANAIAHGRERGLVTISADRLARFAEIFVDDNGPGITPGDEERVFARAVRGSGVRAAGSGLGLALARTIVDRAGGEIFAQRSCLGGARVVLRIPLAKAD